MGQSAKLSFASHLGRALGPRSDKKHGSAWRRWHSSRWVAAFVRRPGGFVAFGRDRRRAGFAIHGKTGQKALDERHGIIEAAGAAEEATHPESLTAAPVCCSGWFGTDPPEGSRDDQTPASRPRPGRPPGPRTTPGPRGDYFQQCPADPAGTTPAAPHAWASFLTDNSLSATEDRNPVSDGVPNDGAQRFGRLWFPHRRPRRNGRARSAAVGRIRCSDWFGNRARAATPPPRRRPRAAATRPGPHQAPANEGAPPSPRRQPRRRVMATLVL